MSLSTVEVEAEQVLVSFPLTRWFAPSKLPSPPKAESLRALLFSSPPLFVQLLFSALHCQLDPDLSISLLFTLAKSCL